MATISYVRIYTGPDGETHFEDVEVDLPQQSRGGDMSRALPAAGVVFRRTSGDYDLDWHPAPRRQFVLNLTGAVEIEVSDGEVRRFGPGSFFLAEDTTGKGHKSRAVEGQERVSVFVQLG